MQEMVRNRMRFGKSPVPSSGKYPVRRCMHAFFLACASCGIAQNAIALPEATPASAPAAAAQSGVIPATTVQPEVAHSGVVPAKTVETVTAPAVAAQSGVAATIPVKSETARPGMTAAVQAVAAQSGVAQTVTAQPVTAQSGVAAAGTVEPKPTPPAEEHALPPPAEPEPMVVAINQPPKRKIVFIQFDVANIGQVDDIDNIYDGLPAAISRRVESGKYFIAAASRYSIPAGDERTRQQAIVQIAGETGAQFLVSGVVADAGINQGTRHIEIALKVYDGFTGTALLSRRFADHTSGDLRVGHDIPFGSQAFFDTDFGGAVSRVINSAVKGIRAALKNIPFAAHIVRTDGNKVLLDAGSNSLLKPGYQLVAYADESRNPVDNLLGASLGNSERPADMITLTSVQPEFSIGQLSHDAALLGIDAGNMAGINEADQRYLAGHPVVIRKIATKPAVVKSEPEKAETPPKAEQAKPGIPGVAHKTGTAQVRALKKSPVITVAKTSPCDQLAALRAACEKKPAPDLKSADKKI
ncbi:MAG: flagella assembly protein FlgT middle domain-containing protein [Gallionella sp.]